MHVYCTSIPRYFIAFSFRTSLSFSLSLLDKICTYFLLNFVTHGSIKCNMEKKKEKVYSLLRNLL